MRISRYFAALLVACAVVLSLTSRPSAQSTQTPARPSIDTVLDTLDKVRVFRETALSPDGQHLAWVVDGAAAGTEIYARDLPSGAIKRVTVSTTPTSHPRERGIVWSPDNKTLAFLSDAAGKNQLQLYVTTPSQPGAPKRVTNATGQLAHPIWSADGKRISLLYVEGSAQETGALVAYKPDAGVVGNTFDEQRIAIADVGAGTLKIVSPANLFVYDYDWSPDGKTFAAEAVEGSGTDNYWTAKLYTVDASSGAAKILWKPESQIACPRWSPDGKRIAVIHGLMSDEGSTGGDAYLVSVDGSRHELLGNVPTGSSVRSLFWVGNDVLLDIYHQGSWILDAVSTIGEQYPSLPGRSENHNVTAISVAHDSWKFSAIEQSFGAAPEVYVGTTKQTDLNESIKPMWGAVKSLHWKSDNFDVQGWLSCPLNANPSEKYPLVVSVHGGPSSAATASWPSRWNAVLPSQGYCVLMPNPRGSYGNGEAFTQANVKDFGGGDLRDILAGVDAAIADGHVDANRVGIIGWSYGGYMTMWAVTQTNRFKAAVAGAGIVSWQSYYGQNRIDQWMIPFFGASVYDDPEVYARSSPITFIKKAKTPTLVLHGDRDSEVPTPQGYEFWHALKSLGVPTELVIYPNEGHGISQPEHIHDIERRLVAWFNKYLH